jgi:hypothetical protein
VKMIRALGYRIAKPEAKYMEEQVI